VHASVGFRNKEEANTHKIRVFREERVPSMANYLESFRESLNQILSSDRNGIGAHHEFPVDEERGGVRSVAKRKPLPTLKSAMWGRS
jgi:hypothetical protein